MTLTGRSERMRRMNAAEAAADHDKILSAKASMPKRETVGYIWHLSLAHIAKCKTHITISETAGAARETGLGFVWEGQGYIPVKQP